MIPGNIGDKASRCHAASAGARRRRRRGVDIIFCKSISLIRMIPFFVDTLLQHVYQVSVFNYKPQARRIPVAESNPTLYTNPPLARFSNFALAFASLPSRNYPVNPLCLHHMARCSNDQTLAHYA